MDSLIVASTEAAADPGLLQALGIDAKLLIEQGIAFLILVFLLGKFVYPALIKAIDSRRDQLEASAEEAKEASQALEKAEASVAKMLTEARAEADDIVARSHKESVAMAAEAEERAKTRAGQIVAEARTQLDSEVNKARQALKKETLGLVALATGKIVKEKLDEHKDAALIEKALQEKA